MAGIVLSSKTVKRTEIMLLSCAPETNVSLYILVYTSAISSLFCIRIAWCMRVKAGHLNSIDVGQPYAFVVLSALQLKYSASQQLPPGKKRGRNLERRILYIFVYQVHDTYECVIVKSYLSHKLTEDEPAQLLLYQEAAHACTGLPWQGPF